MAYKFQLGAAILSGSLTQEGQVLAKDSALSGSSLSLNGVAVGASANQLNLLDNFADAGVDVTDDSLVFFDDTDQRFKRDTVNDFLGAISKNGLEVSSNQLQVKLDGSTLAQSGDGIKVDDGQITNTQLSGNISADKLNIDTNHFNNNAGTLESKIFSTGGIEVGAGEGLKLKLSSSNALQTDGGGLELKSTIAGNRTFSNNVTIQGDLTVTGTTVEVDAAFVVTSSIQFEGTVPDGNELTLTTANPTADRTVTIPDLSGHVPLLAGAISNANVTAAEFALLDGGSTVQTATVEDGDAVLFNDGTTMKHMNVTSLKTYFQTGVTATTAQGFAFNQYGTGSAAQDMNGATGFWAVNSDNGESANAVTLDLSGSWSNGNVVIIKGYNNIDKDSRPMTIRAVGDDTVEGEAGITLESDSAAVTLVYGGGNWNIV